MAKNILIVEDDAFLRDLISKKISSAGFNPIEAVDGKTGLEKARGGTPDLILLDLLLPAPDGFEVLKRLKQDKTTSSIPVIILSNLGQKEDIDKGMQLGAKDYLIKAQFTPEEIITKIKETLDTDENPVPEKSK